MATASACFESCNCRCGTVDPEFDRIAAAELQSPPRLDDLCRAGIGWYTDRTIADHHLDGWPEAQGLYMLWHKNDYCAAHEMFHMRALYVGKGRFLQRLISHWRTKPTAEEMLIYVTHVEMPNRVAKYVEQLLLDTFDFPLNTAENPGKRLLCAHFSQFEVD